MLSWKVIHVEGVLKRKGILVASAALEWNISSATLNEIKDWRAEPVQKNLALISGRMAIYPCLKQYLQLLTLVAAAARAWSCSKRSLRFSLCVRKSCVDIARKRNLSFTFSMNITCLRAQDMLWAHVAGSPYTFLNLRNRGMPSSEGHAALNHCRDFRYG